MPTTITVESHTSPSSSSISDREDDYHYVSGSDIDPSDSASHPPTSSREQSRHRESTSRRRPSQEHRRPSTRVHRAPTAPPSAVDSSEYDPYGRGYGQLPGPYGGRGPPNAYAPSLGSQFPPANPYQGNSQMIPFGAPGGYPYPQHPLSNPFSPSPSPNYFANQPHHPHHGGGYPGGEMMPYNQTHNYPYPPQGYPGQSPPISYYPQFIPVPAPAPEPAKSEPVAKPATPAPPPGPPPPDPQLEIERKRAEMEKQMAEEKYANLQKLVEEQKMEAEKWKKAIADREAAEKAAAEERERNAKYARDTKQQVDAAMSEAQKWKKMVNDRERDEKKAAEEAATRAEIEKAKQQAVDAAMAEAMKWKKIVDDREAAEKKAAAEAAAKVESDKKIKEAVETATKKALLDKEKKDKEAADKAEAEAKAKAEEAAKNKPPKPPPEEKKKPIKFKDAVGRKFSFPFHLCATWQGMEDLIKQAFLHVEVIGPHVAEGHYDLIGPNGEIILPQVWETMIEPDLSITMHMWPMPEPPKAPAPMIPPDILNADPRMRGPGGGGGGGGGGGRGRGPPPPPNVRPGGGQPGPPGWIGPMQGMPPGVLPVQPKKKKPQSSGFLGFGRPSKSSGKGTKKP